MIAAVDRWLLAPVPAARPAALRILVCSYGVLYLVIRTPGFLQTFDLPDDQFEPVGPLAWLGGPIAPILVRAALLLAIVIGIGAVLGWRYRITGPVFAVLFLLLTTYRVSWGQILHTDHLPAIHLLIIGFTFAAAHAPSNGHRPGWPVRVMALVTVTVYVLSGVAKLRYGGMDWVTGDVLRNQVAYDNLRKILLGDVHSPIGGWLVHYGWVFPPIAVFTVAVELGAPVALLGGRTRTTWVIAAWSFHVGIVALMAINFPYELSGVAFAPFFRVERLLRYGRRPVWTHAPSSHRPATRSSTSGAS